MPVAASITSLTVVMLRSFIWASVMTLVDCGVSFWESGRPVAERIHSVVQEPVSSVVVPGAAVTSRVSRTKAPSSRPAATAAATSSSSASVPTASCAAAGCQAPTAVHRRSPRIGREPAKPDKARMISPSTAVRDRLA